MSSSGTPKPSPEVAAVLGRILRAYADRDLDTIRNLYSKSSALRVIGSDVDEFWDATTFLPVLAVQLEEWLPFDFSVTHVEAYELGDVAWGAAQADVSRADGVTFSVRFSMMFVIENGGWRCMQHHFSIPVDNEDPLGFGVALTTTLNDLLDSFDSDTLGAAEGTATLMFTDIEESTMLAQKMGDRMWGEAIDDHDRFVVTTVARHAGTVIKTLGDGALVAFDSARTGLRCAVDLQAGFAERPYAVRIGLHAGEVVRTADDVIGLTVNKAARVAAAATGGQVVISSIVRELVGGTHEFSFGDPFLVELKGIDGVHELAPLELG